MSGTYLAHIRVQFKPGVHDPESETISRALGRLGFDQFSHLTTGKFFDLLVDAADGDEAREIAEEMCEKLLANPVIERYFIQVAEPKINR